MRKTLLTFVAAIGIAGLAIAPAAQAEITTQASTSCGYSLFEQPFLAWNDASSYVLAPRGSFEGGATGWTLSGGAKVVSPGEPFLAQSKGKALLLPKGSVATSPSICVETGYPYSRMFGYTTVRNASYTATLKVQLLYTDATTGKAVTQTITTLADSPTWNPTAKISLVSPDNIKPDSAGRLWVKYRFTPVYNTSWMIDDLYVDPKRH